MGQLAVTLQRGLGGKDMMSSGLLQLITIDGLELAIAGELENIINFVLSGCRASLCERKYVTIL